MQDCKMNQQMMLIHVNTPETSIILPMITIQMVRWHSTFPPGSLKTQPASSLKERRDAGQKPGSWNKKFMRLDIQMKGSWYFMMRYKYDLSLYIYYIKILYIKYIYILYHIIYVHLVQTKTHTILSPVHQNGKPPLTATFLKHTLTNWKKALNLYKSL